jgi:transposase
LWGPMPELGQVSNQRIASLAGLAPFSRDSGQFRGKRMIMGGRVSVRCALYMAALAATRTQQGLRAFYLKLIAAGKPRKLALIAVARKLLVILNTVLGRGTPWQPETP